MENKLIAANKHFVKVPITGVDAGVYKVNVRETDINGTILQTHFIVVEPVCENDVQIKWLTSEGFYKFGTFNGFPSESLSGKDGLNIDNYFTALSDTTARHHLSEKTGVRSITLNKTRCPSAMFLYYMDLATSPKIYMNIGSVDVPNWIECRVQWSPTIKTKKKFHKFSVTFIFPEQYNQRQ